MYVYIKVTNICNGLSKTIDVSDYSMEDLASTYQVYESSNTFRLKIIRHH